MKNKEEVLSILVPLIKSDYGWNSRIATDLLSLISNENPEVEMAIGVIMRLSSVTTATCDMFTILLKAWPDKYKKISDCFLKDMEAPKNNDKAGMLLLAYIIALMQSSAHIITDHKVETGIHPATSLIEIVAKLLTQSTLRKIGEMDDGTSGRLSSAVAVFTKEVNTEKLLRKIENDSSFTAPPRANSTGERILNELCMKTFGKKDLRKKMFMLTFDFEEAK